jgi:hypothetical protein
VRGCGELQAVSDQPPCNASTTGIGSFAGAEIKQEVAKGFQLALATIGRTFLSLI